MRRTCARPPRAHVEILPNPLVFQHFQHRMSIKHMKTYDFLIQKVSKICPRALAESLKKPMVFEHSCQSGLHGPLSRARRTNSTSSALLPEAPSLSNNTMRRTCARPPRAHVEILPNPLVFQHFQHRMSIKHMKTQHFLIGDVLNSQRSRRFLREFGHARACDPHGII